MHQGEILLGTDLDGYFSTLNLDKNIVFIAICDEGSKKLHCIANPKLEFLKNAGIKFRDAAVAFMDSNGAEAFTGEKQIEKTFVIGEDQKLNVDVFSAGFGSLKYPQGCAFFTIGSKKFELLGNRGLNFCVISKDTLEVVDLFSVDTFADETLSLCRCTEKTLNSGNRELQGRIARCYRDGRGIEQNLNLAAEWMRKASDQELGWAKWELFDILWRINTPESMKEAFALAKPLAEAGNSQFQVRLGKYYLLSKCVDNDVATAIMWIKKATSADKSTISKSIDILLCYEGKEKGPYQLAFELCQKTSGMIRNPLPFLYFNGIGTKPNYLKGLRYLIENKNGGLQGGVNTNRTINLDLFEYDEITIIGTSEELLRLMCITMQYNLPITHYCAMDSSLDFPSFFGSKISIDEIDGESAIIAYHSFNTAKHNFFFIMPGPNEKGLLLNRADLDCNNVVIKSQEEYNNLFHNLDSSSTFDIKNVIVDVISLSDNHMYVFRRNENLIFKTLDEIITIFSKGRLVYERLNPNYEYVMSYDVAIGDQFRQLSPRYGINYDNKCIITTDSAESLNLLHDNTISMSVSDHICLTSYLFMSGKWREFFITGFNSIYPGLSWKSDFNNMISTGTTRILGLYELGRLKCFNSHIRTYNSINKPNPKKILINVYGNNINSRTCKERDAVEYIMKNLSNNLLKKEFDVYSNTPFDSQHELPRTKRYEKSISEFLLDNDFACVISILTGFAEVVMISNTNLITLMPPGMSRQRLANDCGRKETYLEINLDGDNDAIIERIEEHIKYIVESMVSNT